MLSETCCHHLVNILARSASHSHLNIIQDRTALRFNFFNWLVNFYLYTRPGFLDWHKFFCWGKGNHGCFIPSELIGGTTKVKFFPRRSHGCTHPMSFLFSYFYLKHGPVHELWSWFTSFWFITIGRIKISWQTIEVCNSVLFAAANHFCVKNKQTKPLRQ